MSRAFPRSLRGFSRARLLAAALEWSACCCCYEDGRYCCRYISFFSRAFAFAFCAENKQKKKKKKSLRPKKRGGDRTPPRTFCKAFVRYSYYLPSSCCVLTLDEESVFRASCIETCTKGIADLMCLSVCLLPQ
jgi:hypothetical protein